MSDRNGSAFDLGKCEYDAALNAGLTASGETKEFFARSRIEWLSRCCQALDFSPSSVLDYGCGVGSATPYLIDLLQASSVVGVDLSSRSLAAARRTHGTLPAKYLHIEDYRPSGTIDLAFTNGVFHHILPPERLTAAKFIASCVRPGGIVAFWENNPINPGTRYVMSKISFDRDAILLSAREARRLLRIAGFKVLRTDYLFLFPQILKALRIIEPSLVRLPLGAQYQVIGRKP